MDQTVQTNRLRKVILNINSFRLIFFGDSVQTFFFPWINRRLRGTFGARRDFTKFIGGGSISLAMAGKRAQLVPS